MKSKLFLLSLCLFVSLNSFGEMRYQDLGLYGSPVSYYRLFVTKKLIDGHQRRWCQILNFPPFDTPSVIFIGESKTSSNQIIVYREFENKRMWIELSEKITKNKLDYLNDFHQFKVLNTLNSSVSERIKIVDSKKTKVIIEQCEILLSEESIVVAEPAYFDGDSIYLTHYNEKNYQTKKILLGDKDKIRKINKELMFLINE